MLRDLSLLKQGMKVKVAQSCPTLRPHGLCSLWNSPGQQTGVGSLSLLQGIFPTQGWNRGPPALQADSLPTELSGNVLLVKTHGYVQLKWIHFYLVLTLPQ